MSEQGTRQHDDQVIRLFLLVREALAGATDALLSGEASDGIRVVANDDSIDKLTNDLTAGLWADVEGLAPANDELRRLVGLLLILPELERSADLAEHIAQRAVSQLGPNMTPASRGIAQRMSDVAVEMWGVVSEAFRSGTAVGDALEEADEELDILLERLTGEVAKSTMAAPVAAQVTLLGRFYERLGDHAVNLARKIELMSGR